MRTFIENYLHFMKNCIRPHYEKLKPLKSGFIENSNLENNRDPCDVHQDPTNLIGKDYSTYLFPIFKWKALHRSGLEVLLLLYT